MSETLAIADSAAKPEFWRWEETSWADPAKDWRSAKNITVGIDVGSVSSQCVVVTDGELYAYNSMRTGSSSPDSAKNAFKGVQDKTGRPTSAPRSPRNPAASSAGRFARSRRAMSPHRLMFAAGCADRATHRADRR